MFLKINMIKLPVFIMHYKYNMLYNISAPHCGFERETCPESFAHRNTPLIFSAVELSRRRFILHCKARFYASPSWRSTNEDETCFCAAG